MAEADIVSLADRLKQRREELGLSQAQAARELDVARTAYRLWEMEAAKPQPDRWRLISRWLGVSVTTMLLADDLDDLKPSRDPDAISNAFTSAGRSWSEPIGEPAEFFTRARQLVQEGAENGFITITHAEELLAMFGQIQRDRAAGASVGWEPARLAKELVANKRAPKAARDAVAFVGADLPGEIVHAAQVLTSSIVANSVVHGTRAKSGILIDVDRERLRVEVTDAADNAAQVSESETGRYGLLLLDGLASRWQTSRLGAGNLTWFEIDLTLPGARPERP
jgi:transcriptional regulator with XRE-family HTH domain